MRVHNLCGRWTTLDYKLMRSESLEDTALILLTTGLMTNRIRETLREAQAHKN
jgi:hypothetical protein